VTWLRGARVLVVEDHRDTREMVASILRGHGARVIAAGSAQAGLLLLEQERPDLIVSDLEMPEVDGYTFLRAVRTLPPDRGGRTPAVALTVHNDTADRVRSLKVGFQVHLPKPVEPERLATIVAGLLNPALRPA
jgi:CheY-like chemotaxis protein